MKLLSLSAALLALFAVACSEDPETPPGEAPATTPEKAPAETPTPAATNDPPSTTSTTTPATDPKPAIKTPTSTLCADQAKELGAKLLFCADFDDARELSGWRNGVFEEEVFEKTLTGDATADLVDGWLILHKPSKANSARFRSTILKDAKRMAFTVDFDVKVTPSAATAMNRFFALSGPITVDGNDKEGKPAFYGRDEISHPYLYGSPDALPEFRHVRLSFKPSDDGARESFQAQVEGHVLKNDVSSSSVAWKDGEDLTLDLMGLTPDGVGGDATFEFDNVLVAAE